MGNAHSQWLVVEDQKMQTRGLMPMENDETSSEATFVSALPLLGMLRQHAVRILLAAVVMGLVALLVTKRLTPLYESTATLEVNPDHASDLLGPDAARTAWNDSDQLIATQLRIIQGDSVLRPVVVKNNLPLESDAPNAPIVLKNLKVVRPPNTYLVQVTYRSSDPVLSANVANGIADSYMKHIFSTRLIDRKSQTSFMEQQLDEVRAAMERSAKAVNEFESKLGVVDAQDKTNIVSARLLQLSTEYTGAQADRIRKQAEYQGMLTGSMSAAQQSDQGENLKQLQTSLDQARQKFVEVREHFGAKHPEYERQAAIVAGLQEQLSEARYSVEQRTQVAYKDAVNREKILQQELAVEKESSDKLNSASYQYQTLKVEAEGNRKLYDDLERRIKEATINGSFQNNTTHMTDPARPAAKAIFPRVGLMVGLAFGITLVLGILIALFVEMSNDTIRSAAQLQSVFHAEVLGIMPQCELTSDIFLAMADEGEGNNNIVAVPKPIFALPTSAARRQEGQRALYAEAVRMLWSSVQLATRDRGLRSLLVTSANPEEGKTTLATRLALINASHQRRTLLIDADLRRPSAHRYAHVPMCPGLSEAMRGAEHWRAFVVPSKLHPQMDVLPAGAASGRSCDDLSQMLPRIMAEAQEDYDLVLVDAPPLLAFADPLHMASAVDGVLLVVRADKTTRKDLSLTLRTLKRVRANLIGVALNQVRHAEKTSAYSYRDYSDRPEAA